MEPSPSRAANAGRNAKAGGQGRWRRWAPARDEAWTLLDRHVPAGARVAVVGVGNGDTVPLARLAGRAGTLDLVDLDPRALRQARRRAGLRARNVRRHVLDITAGEADAIVARALAWTTATATAATTTPILTPDREPEPLGPYDVVVADLFYTQLLYPALADSGRLDGRRIDRLLLDHGQALTNAVVERLHAVTVPGGLVVHLHDLLGWWDGHPQPFTIDELLALGAHDPGAVLNAAARGTIPYGCNPRTASARLEAHVVETAFWRWPFGPATDYLVCATVARTNKPTS